MDLFAWHGSVQSGRRPVVRLKYELQLLGLLGPGESYGPVCLKWMAL